MILSKWGMWNWIWFCCTWVFECLSDDIVLQSIFKWLVESKDLSLEIWFRLWQFGFYWELRAGTTFLSMCSDFWLWTKKGILHNVRQTWQEVQKQMWNILMTGYSIWFTVCHFPQLKKRLTQSFLTATILLLDTIRHLFFSLWAVPSLCPVMACISKMDTIGWNGFWV